VIADTPARRVPASPSRRSERTFYVAMSIAVIAITVFGFGKTWFLRPYFTNPQPLVTSVRVHGAAFTAWVLLLLAQTTLVAAHRTDIHRKLGWMGAALAVFMAGIAIKAALYAVHRDVVCCNAELARGFLIVPVADVLVFSVLVGAAVLDRRDTATHKRLMLLATLSLLDAAIARWPVPGIGDAPLAQYALTDAFIAAAMLYDFASRRSVSPVYVWGGLAIVVEQWARDALGATAAWQSLAAKILE